MKRPLDAVTLFFAVNYFAQGMSGIAYEPVSYLLKDGLGLSAGESAVFVGWMTLPFLLKPLFGLLTDLLPLRGLRRKPHLILASFASAAGWLALASAGSYRYGPLLAMLILVNAGICASDVICDGVMVEQGKERRKTGVYQAVQIGTLYASLVLTGLGGGWLAAHVPARGVFAMVSVFPLMILASSLLVREPEVRGLQTQSLQGLAGLLGERRFWAAGAFIFLWSFAPFLGTAQFYYQSGSLGLSPVFIGFLGTLGGAAGVLGAAFYGRVIGKVWDTDAMLEGAVLVGGPLSLLYVFYLGPVSAAVLTFVLGFAGVAFRLALMDMAAQSCPAHAEATAFAAYMAVFNLAASASNTAGGKLYDLLRPRLAFFADPAYGAVVVLTLIGSLCTLSCWWLLPYVRIRRA